VENLHQLQDIALNTVNNLRNDFYLTGGTALNRFYYPVRNSEDLDFFMPHSINFRYNIDEILNILHEKNHLTIMKHVDEMDFKRFFINNILQIDFVNDRVYKEGPIIIKDNIRLDNIKNILANKITAILSRDETKDVCDLTTIALNNTVNWKEIIDIAQKKEIFDISFFIERLASFPLEWFDVGIKFINQNNLLFFKKKFPDVVNEIIFSLED